MRWIFALFLALTACSYEYAGLQMASLGSCYSSCSSAQQDCLVNSFIRRSFLPECSRSDYESDFFAKLSCDPAWIALQCSGAVEGCQNRCSEDYPVYGQSL
ncbi:MAG: hypothetical protein HS115_10480 [Spirochaetales bacterium]|nr:hypothetical protein [Spirochaetales bacterium]